MGYVAIPTRVANVDVNAAADINQLMDNIKEINKSIVNNPIVNPEASEWQEGTSFANPSNSSYLADNWQVIRDGTINTYTISKYELTQADIEDVGNGITTAIQWNHTVASVGSAFHILGNYRENLKQFQSTTKTFSFYIYANKTGSLNTKFTFNYGSGGSGQETDQLSESHDIVTGWQRIKTTVTFPDWNAKTFGDDDTSFLRIELHFTGFMNSIYLLRATGVMENVGDVALPYIKTSPEAVLADCLRYKEVIDFTQRESIGSVYFIDANSFKARMDIKVKKRIVPTIVLPTGASDISLSISTATDSEFVDSSTLSDSDSGKNYLSFTGDTMVASFGAGQAGDLQIRATSGKIIIDAQF